MICCIFIDMSCINYQILLPQDVQHFEWWTRIFDGTEKLRGEGYKHPSTLYTHTTSHSSTPPPSRCKVMVVIKSPTGRWWNMGVCVCVWVCWIQVRWPWKLSGLFNSVYYTIIHIHTYTLTSNKIRHTLKIYNAKWYNTNKKWDMSHFCEIDLETYLRIK